MKIMIAREFMDTPFCNINFATERESMEESEFERRVDELLDLSEDYRFQPHSNESYSSIASFSLDIGL